MQSLDLDLHDVYLLENLFWHIGGLCPQILGFPQLLDITSNQTFEGGEEKQRWRGDKHHRHNAGLLISGGLKHMSLSYDLHRLLSPSHQTMKVEESIFLPAPNGSIFVIVLDPHEWLFTWLGIQWIYHCPALPSTTQIDPSDHDFFSSCLIDESV